MRHKFALIALGLLLLYVQGVIASECNEVGKSAYELCEDWDGNPADCDCGTFPCDDPNSGGGAGCTWHGWSNDVYCQTQGSETCIEDGAQIVSNVYLSAPNSYKMYLPKNVKGTSDSTHSFTSTSTLSLRFHIRLDTPIVHDGYIAHVIFANTSSSAEWCLDWRVHTNVSWPPPSGEPQGAYLTLHSYNHGNAVGPQFNFNDHIEEWVAYEVHMDFTNKKLSIWVNETKYVDNVDFNTRYGSAHSIILSGFNVSQGSQGHTTYLDNIVVRTDGAYIGPVISPHPPANLRIVP